MFTLEYIYLFRVFTYRFDYYYYYYYYYYYSFDLFTSALADDLSFEIERQQVSSSLQ